MLSNIEFGEELSGYRERLAPEIKSFMDKKDLTVLADSIKLYSGKLNPAFGVIFVTDVLSREDGGEELLNSIVKQAEKSGVSPWENTDGSVRLLALSCLWEMVGHKDEAEDSHFRAKIGL